MANVLNMENYIRVYTYSHTHSRADCGKRRYELRTRKIIVYFSFTYFAFLREIWVEKFIYLQAHNDTRMNHNY